MSRPLTPTMRAELAHIAKSGTFRDLDDYNHGHLAFYMREKVLSGLIGRGLISDAETVTDAGRAVLAEMESAAGGDDTARAYCRRIKEILE